MQEPDIQPIGVATIISDNFDAVNTNLDTLTTRTNVLTNQTNELTIQIDFIYKQINNILARLVEFNELITANRTSIQQMQTRSSGINTKDMDAFRTLVLTCCIVRYRAGPVLTRC